jgi:hypothetical protein
VSTLYVIYTVIFILREVLFVSFIIGMLNFERYQIAAKAEAVRIIIQDVEELGEEICNVWGVDYSMLDYIEAGLQTDQNFYFFTLAANNFWINFTFLNLIVEPSVEIYSMSEYIMEDKCEKSVGLNFNNHQIIGSKL